MIIKAKTIATTAWCGAGVSAVAAAGVGYGLEAALSATAVWMALTAFIALMAATWK